jgi:hypothetical protein
MPKNQTDYSHTFIYKICCNDISINDIYVGHTTNFIKRKYQHKTCTNLNYDRRVYQKIRETGGWNNWSMIQIEEYNCTNKREAEMRERYWIEKLNATLNCNNPITTKEEKDKQKQDWYEENKTEILDKKKEHYEENKEIILEKLKHYAEENKEKIKNYQDEYREKNKEKLYEQKKEYRALHKEEAKNNQKEWRELNKDKIREQKSQIINCECGNQYTFGNKHRHLQSKNHINYQNQLCGIIEEKDSEISQEEKDKIKKQKQKEYREKNAEQIKINKKKYNDSHKEFNSEQRKKYYEEHKNEIMEQSKKYVEENKEKIKNDKQEWYIKNKEKILEKQKQIFICDCGSKVRSSSKLEHYNSVKHNKYIELNNNIINITIN